MSLAQYSQVLPMTHRLQEGAHRVEAESRFLVDLEIGRAVIVTAVEVIDPRDAEFLRGLAHRIENRPGQPLLLYPQFAIPAVERFTKTVMAFRLAEQRQHVIPAPARIAELPPVIIIARLPAHVDHAVDRRTATHDLATRIRERSAIESVFRGGLVAPVGARIAHAIEIADGNVNPVIIIGTT